MATAAAVASAVALATLKRVAAGLARDRRADGLRAAKEALQPCKETACRLHGRGSGNGPWALLELRVLIAGIARLAGLAGIAGLARLAWVARLTRVAGIAGLAEFARVAGLALLAGIPVLPGLAVERLALRFANGGLGACRILAPVGPEHGTFVMPWEVLGAARARGHRG